MVARASVCRESVAVVGAENAEGRDADEECDSDHVLIMGNLVPLDQIYFNWFPLLNTILNPNGPWLGVELRHLAALTPWPPRAPSAARRSSSATPSPRQPADRDPRAHRRREARRAARRAQAGGADRGRPAAAPPRRSIVSRLQAAQSDLAALSAGRRVASRRHLPERRRQDPAGGHAPVRDGWPSVDSSCASRRRRRAGGHGRARRARPRLRAAAGGGEWIETSLLLRDPTSCSSTRLADARARPDADAEGARFRAADRLPQLPRHRDRVAAPHDRPEPPFVFRTDDNGVVQGIRGRRRLAILPRLAVDPNDESVRIVDLGARLQPRLIGLARHSDRYHSPAAEAFVEVASAVCDALQKPLGAAA